MKNYVVYTKEEHYVKYYVKANSKEEAEEKFNSGDYGESKFIDCIGCEIEKVELQE